MIALCFSCRHEEEVSFDFDNISINRVQTLVYSTRNDSNLDAMVPGGAVERLLDEAYIEHDKPEGFWGSYNGIVILLLAQNSGYPSSINLTIEEGVIKKIAK